ncbi:MAG TPA: LLM class flavin-dependent oxidoreductase [bacterium]|nr:LLM class flavin-dependent oxidoreductase [bacterium]
MIPISILDLAPIREDGDAPQAFRSMREQAQHAERLGYHRYWLAEHHNALGIGSSATSVLIGHLAGATKTIRVGSGGIMLPNHAPLVIAEQFGTLASLYPDRIDLGLGRAPGTDPYTMYALRRDLEGAGENFPQDVVELQGYFREPTPDQRVRAIPGAGLKVPIWLLGSSLFSARLAAYLGLPFAFASHFAPELLMAALGEYRSSFRPSEQLDRAYAMVGLNVVAADTDVEAQRLFTSMQVQSTDMLRGRRGRLRPPIDDIDSYGSVAERAAVEQKLACSLVGSRETIGRGLAAFIAETGADELIVTARIHDPLAALRSLEILAEAHRGMKAMQKHPA